MLFPIGGFTGISLCSATAGTGESGKSGSGASASDEGQRIKS